MNTGDEHVGNALRSRGRRVGPTLHPHGRAVHHRRYDTQEPPLAAGEDNPPSAKNESAAICVAVNGEAAGVELSLG